MYSREKKGGGVYSREEEEGGGVPYYTTQGSTMVYTRAICLLLHHPGYTMPPTSPVLIRLQGTPAVSDEPLGSRVKNPLGRGLWA